MFSNLLLAAALQVGPFYETKPDYAAVRPFWSEEGQTTDILWPLWTQHRDWWRFCLFAHYQENDKGAYQFDILPFWFNGHDANAGDYWGLFPLYGHHPHIAFLYDFDFCLWPVWMQYKMPRPSEQKMMTTTAVLFPFFNKRDDGSWGLWPFYGISHNRADDAQYALWPLVTWTDYRADRDTPGAGSSWMFWPFYGTVDRERESQTLVLPPFFSHVQTKSGERWRMPYPIVEWEHRSDRNRLSIFPLYEQVESLNYKDGISQGTTYRYLWRVVEIYPEELRIFPFWSSRTDDRGSYRRLWPFYESETKDEVSHLNVFALFPIRWIDAVDRNWAKFWTFYEQETTPVYTDHSLLWNIIHWRTVND